MLYVEQLFIYQIHGVFAIVSNPFYLYALFIYGIYLASAVVGLYRKVAAKAAVYQGKQFYLRGPAK